MSKLQYKLSYMHIRVKNSAEKEKIMRISAKSRYGLSAMINLAKFYTTSENVSLLSISESLGISKIYLEQVFSLLKRANLVTSVKGSQGGYQLAIDPKKITVYDILSSIETSLFEKTESTVEEKAPDIEQAMHHILFQKLDETVKEVLQNMTLFDLVNETERYTSEDRLMFYI